MRVRFLAFSVAAVAVFYPLNGYGMERAAMDQLLALSHSRPDSPEMREALVKHLGEAAIKSGEAFNSNGPDFVWAVESPKTPTLIVDDQPVRAMRRIAGSDLWFHTAQLRVGTSHRFHYIVDGARLGGSYDVSKNPAGSVPACIGFRKSLTI